MNTNDPLIGQRLSTFLIQQPLGHGGMARVYKGIDTGLKRIVAIKVIEEGLRATATYAQRFEREAQALANLKHPNIVTIFQFGQQDKLYFLVMEYIDGADLDFIMRNYEASGELMPHGDVVRILDAIASALDYAHRQGVIHRDIKPSNIMLERDGRPVLTDFGLALRVSEGTIGDTFGSPHYISPEQARNSANAVPQSDLYSLAVVAYEMLAGAVPFDDPSPTALALQHIMAVVPSPRAFNRNLSEQVEQILIKALAKTPAERYQTGGEFTAVLRQALEVIKQSPTTVSTADLPPLPPGITAPPLRRLSMQTALDKVNQERALTEARGQAPTRFPEAQSDSAQPALPPKGAGWLPYVVAIAGALVALVLVGLLLSKFVGASPISTVTVAPTFTALLATSTVSRAVAAVPTTLIPATASPVPASSTFTATTSPTSSPTTLPTSTPTGAPASPTTPPSTVSPTAVPASPIAQHSLAATTAVPASATTASTQAQVVAPTVAYPDGRLVVLVWDDKSFFASNQSGQRILITNIVFERLQTNNLSTDRFLGNRWAAYYPYSEPNKCEILKVEGTIPNIPRNECPYGYNAELNALQGEAFWTSADNPVQFRVLWNKQEIGRCDIGKQRCEIYLPPS